MFLSCKLKHKIFREAILVAFYGLNQNLYRDSIKFRKLLAEQNFFAANQKNEGLNPFQRNSSNGFFHIL